MKTPIDPIQPTLQAAADKNLDLESLAGCGCGCDEDCDCGPGCC